MSENKKCKCGCCHAVDHGACDDYCEGANGRCVYCDHGEDCHPGSGNNFNLPLSVGVRRNPIIITNPPKQWWPGDNRVEEFMPLVIKAIKRHHEWPSSEFTDIYNRSYEAVYNAIVKYDKPNQ